MLDAKTGRWREPTVLELATLPGPFVFKRPEGWSNPVTPETYNLVMGND